MLKTSYIQIIDETELFTESDIQLAGV